MNIFKKIKIISTSVVLMSIVGLSCKKSFLDEYNPSNQTTTNYYVNADGFESLVTSCYPLLRDITQERVPTLVGTDVFSSGGLGALYYNQPNPVSSAFDQYDIRLNASVGELQTLWDLLYRNINRCNAAIERAPDIKDMPDPLKQTRVCEAKFLRSLCLFWAVQQWGDVPMPLTETKTASLAVTKASSKDIYTQIINDLTECVATLPESPSDVGRASKGAAKFLLARVYLTRGWNFNNSLGGTPADFTSALELCDNIIASGIYPLESKWNNLWPKHNKNPNVETTSAASSVAVANASKEVIFAVQYSNPSAYYGDPSIAKNPLIGNNMHGDFGSGPSGVAQQARTGTYNRFNSSQLCTWSAYRFFDPALDVRYNGTFNSVSYATTAGSVSLKNNKPNPQDITLTYKVGDTTAIALPWNQPATSPEQFGVDIPGGTKKYSVVNPNQYFGLGYNGTVAYVDNLFWGPPMFWKFWQPGIDYGDGYSTFNDPLFRSAEVYLMAAEAIVKGASGAKLGGADVYYNIVLDRALGANAGTDPQRAANPGDVDDLNAVGYRATPADISIDLILDERARELLGEGNERWYDLKRTGTLISRGKKYNPWIAYGLNGTSLIDEHNYLRPLPQGMLDNSNPHIEQNPGY
jgi:hypothetical protein